MSRPDRYRLDPEADAVGTTETGEFEAPPALLVRRFGPPRPDDDYKVSGQYVFVDPAGEPFVVHDWKATSLWDPDLPAPEEFWAGKEFAEFSVSTRDVDPGEFLDWLFEKLDDTPS